MNEKARAARNAYRREWYQRNRDKVRAQQERHWMRKADEAAAAGEQTEQGQET